MNKIIPVKDAIKKAKKLRQKNETVIVAGGCFDILHIGHIRFLEGAKKIGGYLFVILENDKNVERIKGKERPINSQKDRAQVLAAISSVDYVVLLEEMNKNRDYDDLIKKLGPDIIATTKNDPKNIHKLRQAKEIGATVKYVTNRIKNKSTTRLAGIISKNFAK